MENAIMERPEGNLTVADLKTQVSLIQEVMKAVMRKDEHYGTIPGCQKPSLYKPGAEKLLMTFRIATDATVEDLSGVDEARYRITSKGTSILTGVLVGSGVGECSSNEEKYKWRASVCDAEFEATSEDRRRLKFKRDGSTIKQVRTNHADVANTILKMADKRAFVALALKVTAASDIFTQDVEDLPAEHLAQPVAQTAKANNPDPQGISSFTGLIEDINSKSGTSAKGQWTKYGLKIGGAWYGTFEGAMAEFAREAKDGNKEVTVKYKVDGKYATITDIFIPEAK